MELKPDLDLLAFPEVSISDLIMLCFKSVRKGKMKTAVLEQCDHYTVKRQSLPIGLGTRLSWCLVLTVLPLLSVSEVPGKAKSLFLLLYYDRWFCG